MAVDYWMGVMWFFFRINGRDFVDFSCVTFCKFAWFNNFYFLKWGELELIKLELDFLIDRYHDIRFRMLVTFFQFRWNKFKEDSFGVVSYKIAADMIKEPQVKRYVNESWK